MTAIVLINYFNDEEVISFITNYLFTQKGNTFQICVLDNGSKNGALKLFSESDKRILYLNAGSNLGYIGGFLYVAKKISGMKPELLVLSNADIEMNSSLMDSIGNVSMQEDEVMLGPSIISSRTGNNQNPFYEHRISISKLRMLNIAFSNYMTYACYQMLGILKAMRRGSLDKGNTDSRRHVYAIHGSFMVFKTSFIEKYFSELEDAPFLFGEEIQFAEVAYRHKLMTIYDPSFKVKHHEHATTRLFKSRKMLKLLKDSVVFMLKKREEEGA